MSSSRNRSDSAEFAAIMGGTEATPRHFNGAVVSGFGVGNGNDATPPPGNGCHRMARTHLRRERAHPPHNLKIVCLLSLTYLML